MRMQIHTFYCLQSVIYSNHPQCLRFSIGCMLRAFLKAGRALCICKFPGTDWKSREVHGQWKKIDKRKRDWGNRKDLCVERQNIGTCWKKRRAKQELARLGERKQDWACRRNKNGEGEVMLINPSCLLMSKNHTILPLVILSLQSTIHEIP